MGRRWAAWALLVSLMAGIAPSLASLLPQSSGSCTMTCCCGGRCCMMQGGRMASVCPMMAAMRHGSRTAVGCACSVGPGGASTLPVTRGDFCYILPHSASLSVSLMFSFQCFTGAVAPDHGFVDPAEQPPKACC